MALVDTLRRTILPPIRARTFWILGLNLRLVRPVTLVPTPPRYLALPRWVYWRPVVVFFPVKWQTRGMIVPDKRPLISNDPVERRSIGLDLWNASWAAGSEKWRMAGPITRVWGPIAMKTGFVR